MDQTIITTKLSLAVIGHGQNTEFQSCYHNKGGRRLRDGLRRSWDGLRKSRDGLINSRDGLINSRDGLRKSWEALRSSKGLRVHWVDLRIRWEGRTQGSLGGPQHTIATAATSYDERTEPLFSKEVVLDEEEEVSKKLALDFRTDASRSLGSCERFDFWNLLSLLANQNPLLKAQGQRPCKAEIAGETDRRGGEKILKIMKTKKIRVSKGGLNAICLRFRDGFLNRLISTFKILTKTTQVYRLEAEEYQNTKTRPGEMGWWCVLKTCHGSRGMIEEEEEEEEKRSGSREEVAAIE